MTHKNEWAPVPPMGWNSWDCYGAGVTEKAVRGNAEYMAKHLKDHGWQYVVVDIQWSEPTITGWDYHPFAELNMDEYSRLIPAENRFPSSAGGKGFAPLAEYVHSLGLKFGIHIMRGIPRQAVHRNTALLGTDKTARQIAQRYSVCPWNTDMYGVEYCEAGQRYYDSLFELYASWGVDYVKVDDIANTEFKPHEPYSAEKEIEMLRHAIDACGRPIVLSLSPGPAPLDHAWHLCQNANLWRMTGDFWDGWKQLYNVFERCEKWAPYVGDGCWPDCDMLPLGKLLAGDPAHAHMTNFTKDEQITLMSLWCIFRAPLMMGGEMRDNDDFTLALLTNAEALKINQTGGKPRQLFRTAEDAAWLNTAEGKTCIGLFNLSDAERTVSAEVPAADGTAFADAWTDRPAEVTGGRLSFTLPPHGAVLMMQR